MSSSDATSSTSSVFSSSSSAAIDLEDGGSAYVETGTMIDCDTAYALDYCDASSEVASSPSDGDVPIGGLASSGAGGDARA